MGICCTHTQKIASFPQFQCFDSWTTVSYLGPQDDIFVPVLPVDPAKVWIKKVSHPPAQCRLEQDCQDPGDRQMICKMTSKGEGLRMFFFWGMGSNFNWGGWVLISTFFFGDVSEDLKLVFPMYIKHILISSRNAAGRLEAMFHVGNEHQWDWKCEFYP